MLELLTLVVRSLLILIIVTAILMFVAYLFRKGAELYCKIEVRREQAKAYERLHWKLRMYNTPEAVQRRRDQERAATVKLFKNVEEIRNDFE